jgi:hypothetical protein
MKRRGFLASLMALPAVAYAVMQEAPALAAEEPEDGAARWDRPFLTTLARAMRAFPGYRLYRAADGSFLFPIYSASGGISGDYIFYLTRGPYVTALEIDRKTAERISDRALEDYLGLAIRGMRYVGVGGVDMSRGIKVTRWAREMYSVSAES